MKALIWKTVLEGLGLGVLRFGYHLYHLFKVRQFRILPTA